MKNYLFLIWVCALLMTDVAAQNPFIGTYIGEINGDKATLTLEAATGKELKGVMRDSKQTYDIAATYAENYMAGTADETSLGLTFQITGTLRADHLYMDFIFSLFGMNDTIKIDFVKGSKNTQSSSANTSVNNAAKLPAGAAIDPQVTGRWSQESNYSSGYGDNTFSGISVQSIIFNADGSVADGGSRSMISGSGYGGDSGISAAKPIEGVQWYTKDRKLFLVATENGKTETITLGKYYIENGVMLLTGENGKKVLLKKG